MSGTYSYTISDESGTSTIDVTLTSPPTDSTGQGEAYPVTAIGGTIDGNAITGEVGPAGTIALTPDGIFTSDSAVFTSPSGGVLGSIDGIDNDGLVFNVGTVEYNFYTDSGNFEFTTYDTATGDESAETPVTVTATDVPCFCLGTQILTVCGEIAVEDLAVGNLVVTASGVHRPIRWLGHRTTDCRRHPRPDEVNPIRIARHAFGENKPAQDLYVSPGHAICVNVLGEVLIPASALANGSTITQIEVDQVTYWHVELDSHDILIANGLPAESYIEMGNRNFFVENDVIGFDMSPDADIRTIHTHADYCRPLVFSGPALDAVQALLRHRAEELGWALVDSLLTDLHIMAGNTRIDPIVRGLTARFYVPAGVGDAWLVSATSRPIDVGKGDDNRHLGVSLAELTIDDGFGKSRVIALNDPLLSTGFHRFEEGWRWTAGRAHLPAGLWNGYHDGFFLRVQLTSPALPQWVMTPPLAAAPSGQDQAPVPQIA